MKEELIFDAQTALGRFAIGQFTFKGVIGDPERRAYPDMILYANMEEAGKFRLSLHHYSAIKDGAIEGSEGYDGFIGCFDKLFPIDNLPPINIDFHQLLEFNPSATIKSILENIVQGAIFQYGKLVVTRWEGAGQTTTIRLKCFKWWYELELNRRLKYRASEKNLAGGIITSSFIVDGSAKRSLPMDIH